MLETAERLSEDGVPAVQQYLLLVGGLRTLASGEHAAGLVLDAFLLRSLAVAGYAPSFEDCARCGDPGRTGSSTCRPAGGVLGLQAGGSVAPARETLALLGALLAGDWGPPTPAPTGTGGRAAAWSPPICSGTWSAACGPCGWSSGERAGGARRHGS